MDTLKKLFPLSFNKSKEMTDFIITLIIYVVVGAVLGALIGYVVIYAEDHFLIAVTHPQHGLMHIHPGIPEHGAIGMAEIVRADRYRVARSFGQVQDVGFPTARKGLLSHCIPVLCAQNAACAVFKEGAKD